MLAYWLTGGWFCGMLVSQCTKATYYLKNNYYFPILLFVFDVFKFDLIYNFVQMRSRKAPQWKTNYNMFVFLFLEIINIVSLQSDVYMHSYIKIAGRIKLK